MVSQMTTYLVKHILKFVLGKGTALDILDRAQVFGHSLTVLSSHWLHLLL